VSSVPRQQVQRSRDWGATWTVVSSNLPGDGCVAVAPSPADAKTIYAGCERLKEFPYLGRASSRMEWFTASNRIRQQFYEHQGRPSNPAPAPAPPPFAQRCAHRRGRAGGMRVLLFGASGQLGYGNTDTIGDDETPASVGPVNLGAGRSAPRSRR